MKAEPVKTCLWFDDNGEEAARFYVATLGGSIDAVSHYGKGMPLPEGKAMMVEFTLRGQPYQALNGGATFQLTPAVSLSVACHSQDDIDHLWAALLANGGVESRCGWLTDRFGLSWQIYPSMMRDVWLSDDAQAKARAMTAMMGMVKLDCAKLRSAFEGE